MDEDALKLWEAVCGEELPVTAERVDAAAARYNAALERARLKPDPAIIIEQSGPSPQTAESSPR